MSTATPEYQEGQLVFVYNADAGVINALRDLVHKTVSPETYECNLCAVTYGLTGMRSEWSNFVKGLNPAPLFLYRDTFKTELPGIEFPAVLRSTNGQLKLILDSRELDSIKTPTDLISRLQAARTTAP